MHDSQVHVCIIDEFWLTWDLGDRILYSAFSQYYFSSFTDFKNCWHSPERTNNLILNFKFSILFQFSLLSCAPDTPRLRLGVMLLTATAQGSKQNQNKSHSYFYYFIKFTLDQQVKQESQYQKLELCYRLQ